MLVIVNPGAGNPAASQLDFSGPVVKCAVVAGR
jgi:hypothetical protein